MAIRTRILLVVVAVVLVALSVLDVVSYSVVRNSLISQADTQLDAAAPRYAHSLEVMIAIGPGAPKEDCDGLPLDSFAALYTPNGAYAGAWADCWTGTPPTRPRVSASTVSAGGSSGTPDYLSTSSYRMVIERPSSRSPLGDILAGDVLVVGEPLSPMNSTLGNVLRLELLVSGSILAAAGLCSFLLVKLGLRPLQDMAGTAGEIAAGNLSRRVENTDERTEVGRLGSSLNVMLSRIERAFREKEASEERLRRFVADASHELRTPLTSIRGYAELFRNGIISSNPSDLSTAMRRIESESERMSGLVEDLLLLARLDQGRPLRQVPVDVLSLVRDAVTDAQVVARDRTISMVGSGRLVTIGDPERLAQILVNLVSNSLAYTPASSPIEVVASGSATSIRVVVIDHGPGIPLEERDRIFDRFWRADASRSHRSRHESGLEGGNGLGLSIVVAVVGAHGGTVTVSDTPGGGATFAVELPRAPFAVETPAPAPPELVERPAVRQD